MRPRDVRWAGLWGPRTLARAPPRTLARASASPAPSLTPSPTHSVAHCMVSSCQRQRGPWSVCWSGHIISWTAHVLRKRSNACWSAKIFHVRSTREVLERRIPHGHPQTGIQSGFCRRRYKHGVPMAFNYLSNFVDKPSRHYALQHDYCCTHFLVRFISWLQHADFDSLHAQLF